MNMKNKSILRLSYLAIFMMLLLAGCENDAFGEDMEVPVLPTNLSYSDIIGAREFSLIESSAPTINSNGHPVSYEIVSIKKGEEILDASYIAATNIVNPTVIESEVDDQSNPGNSWTVNTSNLHNAGKVIIEEGNPFANGEYLFTIKATVTINYAYESVVFEDALRLVIGPELVEGMSYCPFKINFVSGESLASNPAEVFGGNPDIRFELVTESDKLSIDPVTGAISLNPSYTISTTEYINPIINIVSNITEETIGFEETFTAVLSTGPVVLDRESDYFFYPKLSPSNDNIPRAGGDGYTVNTDDFVSKPGWVQKHFYKKIVNNSVLSFPEVLDTRAEAEVSGITGSQFNYWGPLKNPFESWLIANPVNLALYSGCFDTKAVFWVKQHITQGTLDNIFPGHTETPVGIEIKISDNYSGDVSTTSWTSINELLTCKIGEAGAEFVGTPYPISGEVGAEGSANNLWVKCEMELPTAEYGDMTSFTIAFRTKTNYDSDLPDNLRGELYISDLHFVATEK